MGNEIASLDVIIRMVADEAGAKLTEQQITDLKKNVSTLGVEGQESGHKMTAGLGHANMELREGGRLAHTLEIAMQRGLNPMQAVNLVRELGRVNGAFGSMISAIGGTGVLAGVGIALALAGAAWSKYAEHSKKESEAASKAIEEHKKQIDELIAKLKELADERAGKSPTAIAVDKASVDKTVATEKKKTAEQALATWEKRKEGGFSEAERVALEKREPALRAERRKLQDAIQSQISEVDLNNNILIALRFKLIDEENKKVLERKNKEFEREKDEAIATAKRQVAIGAITPERAKEVEEKAVIEQKRKEAKAQTEYSSLAFSDTDKRAALARAAELESKIRIEAYNLGTTQITNIEKLDKDVKFPNQLAEESFKVQADRVMNIMAHPVLKMLEGAAIEKAAQMEAAERKYHAVRNP